MRREQIRRATGETPLPLVMTTPLAISSEERSLEAAERE